MTDIERRRKILRILEAEKSISVRELIESVNSSPATVRRDLNLLENQKLLVRTHGNVHLPEIADEILPVDERLDISANEKKAIAREALKLIEPGMSIILDSGTTTLELAKILPDIKLTVVTNSLDICAVLWQGKNSVICCGGLMEKATRSFLGADAVRYIESIDVDAAFIGTTGIRKGVGLTTSSPLQADFKRATVKSATKKYALFDYSKLDSASLYNFVKFSDLDKLITTRPRMDEGSIDPLELLQKNYQNVIIVD